MAKAQSSTPSFFNFLKEGVLLPARNRSLFLAVFAFLLASTSLVFLGQDFAIQPLRDKLNNDAKAFNSTDPGSPEFKDLVVEIHDDTRNLFLAAAGYALFAIIVGSVIQIIVLFAAVTTYSGELATFGELFSKAKAQAKGPLLTSAFVYGLELACFVLLLFLFALLAFLMIKHYFSLLFVALLVFLLVVIFFVYFSFLCSLAVVVAVAEPGCYGPGAVGRAWRLGKHRRWRAALFIVATAVLAAVVYPVHTLAKTCALSNLASGLLLEFVYAVLMAAVKLFAVCTMTAFYYECKGSTDDATIAMAATGYVKVPTEDA